MSDSIDRTVRGHHPVLLAEVVAALEPAPGRRYLDSTFGGGGHTRALLDASAPSGVVIALDTDASAIERAEMIRDEGGYGERLIPIRTNFSNLAEVVRQRDLAPVDGVLLDLGLSSFQLDSPERGFAFRFEGPLDMRFDPDRGAPASELVNSLAEDKLADLIWRFGEEPGSRRVAHAIVRERKQTPIETTTHLAKVSPSPGRSSRARHPSRHPDLSGASDRHQ